MDKRSAACVDECWIFPQRDFYHWIVSTHPPPIPIYLSPPLSFNPLPSSFTPWPSFLSLTTCVFQRYYSPVTSKYLHQCLEQFKAPSARGASQTHLCSSYWGMKLLPHPLRATKKCFRVEKLTQILTDGGWTWCRGKQHLLSVYEMILKVFVVH